MLGVVIRIFDTYNIDRRTHKPQCIYHRIIEGETDFELKIKLFKAYHIIDKYYKPPRYIETVNDIEYL